MSLLDPIHPSHGPVIEVLAAHPGIEIEELRRHLAKEHDLSISVSNLYRTVAQLIEKQVLVKEKSHLSLNLVWVSHLVKFSEALERQYIAKQVQVLEIPEQDEGRREFKADSLASLDPIWNHVLAGVARMYKDAPWYQYDSHPWFAIGTRKMEHQLYEQLGGSGHILYGNTTFLDKYGAKLVAQIPHALTDAPPFLKDGYSAWVCGDYIVDCIFPDAIAHHFAFFFQTVKSVGQFDADLFADVFKMKARCSIVVRKSKKDAPVLRDSIRAFFVKGKRK